MWELDLKEGWAPKSWCFLIVVLEKTLESPLNRKGIKPVNPKKNQSWVFIGRTDAKLKLQYFGHLMQRADSLKKTLMLGKIEGRKRSRSRGWDGSMASLTQWTWVWANSGRIVKDRKAWCTAVRGVTKDQTRLITLVKKQHKGKPQSSIWVPLLHKPATSQGLQSPHTYRFRDSHNSLWFNNLLEQLPELEKCYTYSYSFVIKSGIDTQWEVWQDSSRRASSPVPMESGASLCLPVCGFTSQGVPLNLSIQSFYWSFITKAWLIKSLAMLLSSISSPLLLPKCQHSNHMLDLSGD